MFDTQFLFGSIAQWGPQAARYIHKVKDIYKVVAQSETHVGEERIPMEKELLRKDGWKLSATPACRKNSGFSAGDG
eukprot:8515314-Pyramimonas_sp.AAC.1